MVRPPDPLTLARSLPARFTSPLRSRWLTARLGMWLGIAFGICLLTGVLSHLIQHPPAWFHWPSRPVQLYRITQGLHIASGLASIPLLTAKVWSVFPKLFAWPPVRGAGHALDRAAVALLSAAAVFELVTGVLNIAYWYSAMPFGFVGAHYWTAYLLGGAVLLHLAAKLPVARAATRPPDPARRRVLTIAGAAAATVTVATIGQTFAPLGRLSLLAPRLPGVGPQGLPVNKTAAAAQVARADAAYRLTVTGPGGRHALSLADLEALPQTTVELPIACVEGWSATGTWSGVRLVDLLRLVGAEHTDRPVRIESLQPEGPYRESVVEPGPARDPLTLIALRLDDEPLHLDHGFPCRLIAPNRPGVLQTKWIAAITVVDR
ncbi:molybdopterin-dependent oxidoreductase [Dactylosporangium vinaceum]|uniref:Molybdopterin-dependent oxidoreductase n=1 Tax=Dactylosporangium vinaceum TaxID=53362 RepID=A0ABV5MJZ8_9ACTN|nr:molybdopterin-dependent oxidoreductase [Dactylosporangium vinaceum]UAB92747.1 molybdopterin-dependent oxidoreductase [Dactylosporangium vinaceum]